jgi:hypothetical protein
MQALIQKLVPYPYSIISDELLLSFIYDFKIWNINTLIIARKITWIFPLLCFKRMFVVAKDLKYSKIASDIVLAFKFTFVFRMF